MYQHSKSTFSQVTLNFELGLFNISNKVTFSGVKRTNQAHIKSIPLMTKYAFSKTRDCFRKLSEL